MTKKQQKVIRELKKEKKNLKTALKGVLKEIELRDKLGKKVFKDTGSEIQRRIKACKNCNPSADQKRNNKKEKNRCGVNGINELKKRGVLG